MVYIQPSKKNQIENLCVIYSDKVVFLDSSWLWSKVYERKGSQKFSFDNRQKEIHTGNMSFILKRSCILYSWPVEKTSVPRDCALLISSVVWNVRNSVLWDPVFCSQWPADYSLNHLERRHPISKFVFVVFCFQGWAQYGVLCLRVSGEGATVPATCYMLHWVWLL
jgi:hypothetical protein